MTTPTLEFVSKIRDSETIEEEREVISNELADMRTMIRSCDSLQKAHIITKLIYLNITGENTAWGQIDAVSLMSSSQLSFKRFGYLAVQTLFDEQSEILVLITQTLRCDLNSSNPLIQALPLNFIANMGTAEMCQSVYTEVEKLTASVHPGIVKRAGMASARIIRKLPELSSFFKKALNRMLSSSKHAVVSAGVTLAMEMIRADPSYVSTWGHFAKPFTQLLSALSHSRPTAEFRLAIFNDPFLQNKTMQLLQMLKKPSDELDEALTFLVTTVDARRNTGRSLLLQAIETIGLTAKKQTLCGLAFNQIGRLLNNDDPNILYSCLSAFSKILYNGSEIIDRSSHDSLALQRYKLQIVHCLDHKDPSIRRRALDVILALVDANNVLTLVPEIIDYLHLADSDFRTDMIVKIYSVVQRFAPTPMWHFDIIHTLLIDSGNYVGNDILTSICRLIATNEEVRNHAIPLLINTMSAYCSNQAIIKVAAWVLGEFLLVAPEDQSNENCSLIDTIIRIYKMPQTKVETKCYLVTAMAKIAARLNIGLQKVKDELANLSKDINIEIQQRAGELHRILQNPELWEEILAPSAYKKTTDQNQSQATAQIIINDSGNRSAPETNSNVSKSQSGNLIHLDFPAASASSNPFIVGNTSQETKPAKDDLIDDLLDLSLGPLTNAAPQQETQQQISSPAQQTQQEPAFRPPPNAVVAVENHEFVVYFEIQKNPANPKQIAIRSTIVNPGMQPLKNFEIKYGVPPSWSLQASPPNSNTLNPLCQNSIQQVIYLQNNGNAPLMMKTHATYLFGCQPLSSTDNVNPIF